MWQCDYTIRILIFMFSFELKLAVETFVSEGILCQIQRRYKEGSWLLGLQCFYSLHFLSYSCWCISFWDMLSNFIITLALHHLEDGQICLGGSLGNSMRYFYSWSPFHFLHFCYFHGVGKDLKHFCYMKENNSPKCLSYFMETFERRWGMYFHSVTEWFHHGRKQLT